MSANEDLKGLGQDGWFVKVAGVVGDLGNPFYREERHRDVWNESSAVGLQLVLWAGLGAAVAMVWLGGAGAVLWLVWSGLRARQQGRRPPSSPTG